jgi:hypothetical protein
VAFGISGVRDMILLSFENHCFRFPVFTTACWE